MTRNGVDSLFRDMDSLQERANDSAVVSELSHGLDRPLIDGDLKLKSVQSSMKKDHMPDLMPKNERPLRVVSDCQCRGNHDAPAEHIHVRVARRVPELKHRANHERCCKANRGKHETFYNGAV